MAGGPELVVPPGMSQPRIDIDGSGSFKASERKDRAPRRGSGVSARGGSRAEQEGGGLEYVGSVALGPGHPAPGMQVESSAGAPESVLLGPAPDMGRQGSYGVVQEDYLTAPAGQLEIDLRAPDDVQRLEEIVLRRHAPGEALGMTLEGTVVTHIVTKGIAARAGLALGDRIMVIEGARVETYAHLAEVLARTRNNPAVVLEVLPSACVIKPEHEGATYGRWDGPAPEVMSRTDHPNLNDFLAPSTASLPDRWADQGDTYAPPRHPQTDTSFAFWKSPQAVQLRAAALFALGLLSFVFYVIMDDEATCEADIEVLLIVNAVILMIIGLVMFFVALFCSKSYITSRGYARSVFGLTGGAAAWMCLWLLIQTERLHQCTRENCGEAFDLNVVLAVLLFAVVGLFLLCFCASATHTGDEEYHALAYVRQAL